LTALKIFGGTFGIGGGNCPYCPPLATRLSLSLYYFNVGKYFFKIEIFREAKYEFEKDKAIYEKHWRNNCGRHTNVHNKLDCF